VIEINSDLNYTLNIHTIRKSETIIFNHEIPLAKYLSIIYTFMPFRIIWITFYYVRWYRAIIWKKSIPLIGD